MSAALREKYDGLASTYSEMVESNPEDRLIRGKLHELLWTYLTMLVMENITKYLAETDTKEIDRDIAATEANIKALGADKERLRTTKTSLLETLREHQKSVSDAQDNLQVLSSELARLEAEIQLLRADAIANKNSDILSAKIDASVESLRRARILRTMSNVNELAFDLPADTSNIRFTPYQTGSDQAATPRPRARARG